MKNILQKKADLKKQKSKNNFRKNGIFLRKPEFPGNI